MNRPKTLSAVKPGDYVCYNRSYGSRSTTLVFCSVVEVDDVGRIYLQRKPEGVAGWRKGFYPTTGQNAAKDPAIRVPSQQELDTYLKEKAAQDKERRQREERQSRQDYCDASFLASCDTEGWLEHFTPDELSQIANTMRRESGKL